MANDVGSITASLKLESAAFIREMNRAAQTTAKSTSQMQRSLGGLQATFARLGGAAKGFAAGFISVAAVRSFAAMATNAVKFADGIGDVAAALGITSEALQRYRQAGEQADVTTEEMDAALKMFQRSLSKGVIQDNSFEAFIQRLREEPDHIKRVALAREALNKQAQIGILLSLQSAEAWQKNWNEASVVSQEAIDNADRMSKGWAKFENALSAGFAEGFLKSFSGEMGTSAEQIEDFKTAAEGIGEVAGRFTQWIGAMIQMVVSFIQWLGQIPTAMSNLKGWLNQNLPGRGRGSEIPGEGGVPLEDQSLFGTPPPVTDIAALTDEINKTAKAAAAVGAEFDAMPAKVKKTKEAVEELPQHVQEISNLFEAMGNTIASGFANAIVEGEKFSEVLDKLLKQLAEMALSAVLRMLIGNIIGAPTQGGVTAGSGILGALFHGGGIVGAGGPRRLVPSAAFAAAPRFHNGFMPGEMPAILKKGEGVFTPEQMKSLGGGVTVNVINKNDSDVKVNTQENSNGGVDIEVMIDQVVARKIGQTGSSTNRMLSQFGVKQPPIRR